MDNEEIQGVKFSEFPSATPGNSDEVVGLHAGGNARFTIANIVAAVRNGLENIFVPKTDVGSAGGVASLDSTGKVPTSQLPSSTGPEPATATPLMDGTGAIGVSTKYAREDHEHPADTNKQAKITASGILKGDGAGGVSAATAGTDYQAPLTAGTDYATPAQLASLVLKTESAFALPASGSSVSKDMSGLTADHELIRWNFYDNGAIVPENQPPADLTWTTYAGYFTITNNGGTTTATIQPIFALPSATAISNH